MKARLAKMLSVIGYWFCCWFVTSHFIPKWTRVNGCNVRRRKIRVMPQMNPSINFFRQESESHSTTLVVHAFAS